MSDYMFLHDQSSLEKVELMIDFWKHQQILADEVALFVLAVQAFPYLNNSSIGYFTVCLPKTLLTTDIKMLVQSQMDNG